VLTQPCGQLQTPQTQSNKPSTKQKDKTEQNKTKYRFKTFKRNRAIKIDSIQLLQKVNNMKRILRSHVHTEHT
jgi:hypothetical protein